MRLFSFRSQINTTFARNHETSVTCPLCLTGLLGLMCLLAPSGKALAETEEREFPVTLVVEEPQTETQIAPAMRYFGNADGIKRTDFIPTFSVQLAEPFAILSRPAVSFLRPGGTGFQNLETTLKYQVVTNGPREFVMSVGLSAEWGGTGVARVDAEPFTSLTPTLFFGKGAGDLPDHLAFLRPLAVTAQAGVAMPLATGKEVVAEDGDETRIFLQNPYIFRLAGSFQYSLPYAIQNNVGFEVPAYAARFIPLIEYSVDVPIARNGAGLATRATVNPGFIWSYENIQIGVEALVPVNKQSGHHPGFRLQLAYTFEPPWLKASHAHPAHDEATHREGH